MLPLLRFALYADLMLLFGMPLFWLHALRGEERRSGAAFAFRRWIVLPALIGLALAAVTWLVLVAGMAGIPIGSLDMAMLGPVTTGTPIGLAFCVRIGALLVALLAGAVIGVAPLLGIILATVAGGIAMGSLAWGGHATMADGVAGWIHLSADIAHLLAAGLWLGALVALLRLVLMDLRQEKNARLASRALHGFSTIGTIIVIALTTTGLINVWMVLLRSEQGLLPLDGYRLLLLLKLLAFGGMIALAAANRWVFAKRVARGDAAIRPVIAMELALGLSILALVALLGTMAP